MKNNSKKHGGFGLLEVVISMALIAIISVGVYNGYMLMIRQTKASQEKQITALIGKQVTEEIKLSSGKIIFNNLEEDSKLNLTNDIQLRGDGADGFSGELNFDENGKRIMDDNFKYKAKIVMRPKKTDDKHQDISINSIENDSIKKIYIAEQNGIVKLLNKKPSKFDDKSNENNNINGIKETTILINISAEGSGRVSIEGNESQYTTFIESKIKLDFKYYTSKIKIKVINEYDKPIDLYILNSIYISENQDELEENIMKRNVTVENVLGRLNEYYRSEEVSKIGKLYNINLKVVNKKDDELKPFFESNFVQNINIKQN